MAYKPATVTFKDFNKDRKYVTFKCGEDLLCLPLDYVQSWTPSQKRWSEHNTKGTRISPEIDARCNIAADLYAAKTGKWNVLKPLSPRLQNKFQWWLRKELMRLNLI